MTTIIFGLFVVFSLIFYWQVKPVNRKYIILVSNILFYISYGWMYIFALIGLIGITYISVVYIIKKKTRIRLALAIILILSPLLFFKYSMFGLRILDLIFGFEDLSLRIIAPLGISYYTFQSISFVVDVYKGKIDMDINILYLAIYMSFFPTVTSGPIQRYQYFINSFNQVNVFDENKFILGCERVLLGCFKKFVIADRISSIISPIIDNVYNYDGFSLVLTMIGYTIMLYCDFSGYSDIAIGIAKMYGINISENFKMPYFAISIKDFWDRWHLSLSTWLRDYIYIPLGGSKKSKLRTYVNILITFAVSGLWHGAGFSFIIWGGMHGIVRCIERLFGFDKHKKIEDWMCFSIADKLIYIIRNIITFILLTFMWTPFALQNVQSLLYCIKNAFLMENSFGQYISIGLNTFNNNLYSIVIILSGLLFLYIYEFFIALNEGNYYKISNKKFLWIFMLFVVVFFNYSGETTFIYGGF